MWTVETKCHDSYIRLWKSQARNEHPFSCILIDHLCFFLISAKIRMSSASICFLYLNKVPAHASVKPSSAIWEKTNPSALINWKFAAFATAIASLLHPAKIYFILLYFTDFFSVSFYVINSLICTCIPQGIFSGNIFLISVQILVIIAVISGVKSLGLTYGMSCIFSIKIPSLNVNYKPHL